MSIRVMSMVWDSGPTKQGHLLVMLALADYANDQAQCWPSIKSIAEKARMTERGVQKIVRTLEAEGWLKIDTGNGRKGCNQYTLNPEPRSPRTSFTPNLVHPEQGCTKTPNDDAETLNGGSPEPSITINEPSDTISACAKSPDVDPPPKKARLPEGWVPSPADQEYAFSQNLTHDEIQDLADDFHAYWRDRTDSGGKKSERGWSQCWKNRVRDRAPFIIRSRSVARSAVPTGYGRSGGIAGEIARRRSGG